jgi:hypothetical protein
MGVQMHPITYWIRHRVSVKYGVHLPQEHLFVLVRNLVLHVGKNVD